MIRNREVQYEKNGKDVPISVIYEIAQKFKVDFTEIITGNTAWLKFPFLPVSIGPAEFVKISFCMLLAKQLEWLQVEKRDLRSFPSAMMVAGHALGMCGLNEWLLHLISHLR